jgi:putative tryptophan/tyrosine transport system substrate-binding protein
MDRRESRIGRRQFVLGAAGLGLLAGCGRLPWQGEPPAKVARVGLLWATAPLSATQDSPVEQGLREYGYVEGQHVIIERRSAESQFEQLPELASELASLPVDVIVAMGEPAVRAARDVTRTIPIVMHYATDPVAAGIVQSLARPGGNVTGLATLTDQLNTKRLELLKETVPGIAHVGFIGVVSADIPTQGPELEAAGRALGVQVEFMLPEFSELESALETALANRVEALLAVGWAAVQGPALLRIVEFAAQRRLPVLYWDRRGPDAGGLMSYGPNLGTTYRRAAYYVDRILKGAKPADLPVEQPREFEFVVNLKTAQALGITFPNEIMLQVTEVIE